MSDQIPPEIQSLFAERQILRAEGKFSQSDEIREQLIKLGYEIKDTLSGSELIPINKIKTVEISRPGLMAIFGSGEVSSTGRRVHELLVNKFKSPVKIALLETPTGYEDNPHLWHIKMAEFMVQGLGNYHPEVNRIEALAKFDIGGTNDDRVLKGLDEAVYIHAGAGSPSYALKHLQDSLAFKKIISAFENGASVSFASAMAIAAGKYCLPVYEMYFAGHDPSWLPGLDFLGRWGLNLTIIPHWNNTEGGKDIDTRFAYMGEKRFLRLINILPGPTTIMGIDEHTAAVFDIKNKIVSVMGKGEVHLFGEHPEAYKNGSQIPFAQLTRMCYFPK